ncbi:MAG TPA: GNAT family N-acetyltransferase [Herpetosiphonaceae bacterium]
MPGHKSDVEEQQIPSASSISIRDLTEGDQAWMQDFLLTYNHSLRVVSRGTLHYVPDLPGLIATYRNIPSALLTYTIVGQECEVVTLHAAVQRQGLGARLLATARRRAQALGCSRLWLITTNDNEPAIRFYQRQGMTLVAVHHNALAESRKLKPEIPLVGLGGKPLRDEIEFEFRLGAG